jgi:hypothetical protein
MSYIFATKAGKSLASASGVATAVTLRPTQSRTGDPGIVRPGNPGFFSGFATSGSCFPTVRRARRGRHRKSATLYRAGPRVRGAVDAAGVARGPGIARIGSPVRVVLGSRRARRKCPAPERGAVSARMPIGHPGRHGDADLQLSLFRAPRSAKGCRPTALAASCGARRHRPTATALTVDTSVRPKVGRTQQNPRPVRALPGVSPGSRALFPDRTIEAFRD